MNSLHSFSRPPPFRCPCAPEKALCGTQGTNLHAPKNWVQFHSWVINSRSENLLHSPALQSPFHSQPVKLPLCASSNYNDWYVLGQTTLASKRMLGTMRTIVEFEGKIALGIHWLQPRQVVKRGLERTQCTTMELLHEMEAELKLLICMNRKVMSAAFSKPKERSDSEQLSK